MRKNGSGQMATTIDEEMEEKMEHAICARNDASAFGRGKSAVNPIALVAVAIAAVLLAITVGMCAMPSDAYAASTYTASKTNYVAGTSSGKLWAKDTIQYTHSNGKIVSKPTVKQQASAICQIQTGIKGPIYGCFFKYKEPSITYSNNAKTATVTTYWVCKQGFSIKGISADWHKKCTVTYTCDGNGKITVSKKVGRLQFG